MINYNWNQETKCAEVIIKYDGHTFVGRAKCHEQDKDFGNSLVGLEIATNRAIVAQLQWVRNNELRPALQVLSNFYYSVNRSKNYHEKHYTERMLEKAIQRYKDDIVAINEEIEAHKKANRDLIEQKDKLYKSWRRRKKH